MTQYTNELCKKWIRKLVFDTTTNFLAENWQKSQKIVIITSTPGVNLKKYCIKQAITIPIPSSQYLQV
jgi:hypothetical protein